MQVAQFVNLSKLLWLSIWFYCNGQVPFTSVAWAEIRHWMSYLFGPTKNMPICIIGHQTCEGDFILREALFQS